MYLSKKVHLKLTQNQTERLLETIRMTTCVYNETLNMILKNYNQFGYSQEPLALIRKFRRESKINPYANSFADYLVNRAIRDAYDNFQYNFVIRGQKVKFKSIKHNTHSFTLGRPKVLKVSKEGIFIGGLGSKETKSDENYFRFTDAGSVPYNRRLDAMRIYYDGISFYFVFSFETTQRDLLIKKSRGVGIDVGIKTLATLSDGRIYSSLLSTTKMQNLLWRRREIQSEISELRHASTKAGEEQERSCKLQKLELKFKKLSRHIRNVRRDYLNKVSFDIIKLNPAFIAVENLKVRSMLGEKPSLTDRLEQTALKMFLDMLEYKAMLYKIPFIKVEQKFPSSKKCCNCGNIKSDLKLSDRTYFCDVCGFAVDRDINAAVNIYKSALCTYRMKRYGCTAKLEDYYTKEYKSWKKLIAKYIV